MIYDAFVKSIEENKIPAHLPALLQALWHAGNNDWNKAHEIVQDISSKEASWIHAYLHRVEDDIWNADYWYSKAGRKRPLCSTEEEWKDIVQVFLSKNI